MIILIIIALIIVADIVDQIIDAMVILKAMKPDIEAGYIGKGKPKVRRNLTTVECIEQNRFISNCKMVYTVDRKTKRVSRSILINEKGWYRIDDNRFVEKLHKLHDNKDK